MKSILPDQYAVEKQFNSRVDNFFAKYEISRRCNFRKTKGFSCLEIFKFIFLLVSGKNLYRTNPKLTPACRRRIQYIGF
jgi:hypothetical protein